MKTKWWLNFALFGGFIATFFVDFFGIEIHQWLGLVVGGLAYVHLVDRWNWFGAVTRRFFARTSSQARRFYLVDVALFAGFFLVTGSGLVISTWLNLSPGNYSAWLVFHITVSILTLLVLLLKLVLHNKWIEAATHIIFSTSHVTGQTPVSAKGLMTSHRSTQPGSSTSRVGSPKQSTRREFLQVMGVIGAASLLALVNAMDGLQEVGAHTEQAPQLDSTASQNLPGTSTVGTASSTHSSLNSASSNDASSNDASTCYVECWRGCSYPGRCRRYVDANNNNLCDLGECL